MSTTDVSVVICTHNPQVDNFRRVLCALQAQSLPFAKWELLVIDNASTEPVADRFDISWHPGGRNISESELGLTNARLCGINEAKSELLVFVDDDNILEPDYLQQALNISVDYPYLGAWSGTVTADFEQEPEDWTKPYWGKLAVRSIHHVYWSNDSRRGRKPSGAGLCVRSNVADLYRNELSAHSIRRLLGRKGASLFSTEDTDLVLTSQRLQLGWGLFPQLKLKHVIPASRLTENYLLRLTEEMAASGTVFDLQNGIAVAMLQGWKKQLRYFNLLAGRGPRAARFYLATERGKKRGAEIYKNGGV